MDLALSAATAPDLSIVELLDGCRRRGLAALELVVGDGYGAVHALDPEAADAVRLAAHRARVRVCGVSEADAGGPFDRGLRFARLLQAPIIVNVEGRDPAALAELCADHVARGGRALFLHHSDFDAVDIALRAARLLPDGAAGCAWEIDPGQDDTRTVTRLPGRVGPALEYVRLRGGGPESAGQSGLGIGAVMARLALARYAGPLVVTPSTPRYRYAWRAWLGHAGGWGCGSKRSDPSLVSLES